MERLEVFGCKKSRSTELRTSTKSPAGEAAHQYRQVKGIGSCEVLKVMKSDGQRDCNRKTGHALYNDAVIPACSAAASLCQRQQQRGRGCTSLGSLLSAI